MLTGGHLIGLITVESCIAFFLFGYDNGVLANLINDQGFLDQFNPSTRMLGNLVSFLSLGAGIGAFLTFFVLEDFGRRRAIYLGSTLMTIGAIIQATSYTSGQLLAGRIICGLGLGMNTSAVPAWQSECVPKNKRGSLMTTDLLWVTGGALFAYWFDYGVIQNLSGPVVYRLPLAFQLLFTCSMLILMPFLPESPRWLALHGRRQEALEVLARLDGGDITADSPAVHIQYEAIMNAAEIEGHLGSNNFRMLFTLGKTQNFRRVILGVGVNLMNPWSGINVSTYYFPYILSNVLHKSPHFAAIIGGCNILCSVIFVIPTILLIDRIGRKPLLCTASVIQCICLAILTGLLSKVTSDPSATGVGAGCIAVVFIYSTVFAMSWLPTSYMYCAELLPITVRSKGCALGTMCYWLGTFATAEITPIGIANISYRFFIIFTVFNGVIAIIIGVFYKETAGLSLEQIELLYVKESQISADKNMRAIMDGAKIEDQTTTHIEEVTAELRG